MSAETVNKVFKELVDLCILGDSGLTKETGKAFKKVKELTKGIAFLNCISVNNCICYFFPLTTEPDVIIANEDMVKMDMGAHINGSIVVVVHTVVAGATVDNPVTGSKADALMAVHLASAVALRLVKPGNGTYEVKETGGKTLIIFLDEEVVGLNFFPKVVEFFSPYAHNC